MKVESETRQPWSVIVKVRTHDIVREENDMDWFCETSIDGQVKVRQETGFLNLRKSGPSNSHKADFWFSADIIDPSTDCVGLVVDEVAFL